ncbi:MAG: SRPBCC family protein [Pseudomonadota bacterium]
MARVYTSSVINAPASDVWDRVRDFNGLPKWHPRIRDSRIEDALPADKVGCIRNFHLQNGELIREQLLGLSDYDMFCTYSILESPMPLEDYLATLRLTPVTEGDRTFIEWTAEFSCAPSDEDGLVEGIGMDVFQAGFDSLKRHFGSS